MLLSQDTIAAIATPPGNGGVGIIRISGPNVTEISKKIIQKEIKPRHAIFTEFMGEDNGVIDSGICLYFPEPASYTGEDTLELQGHGGSVVLDMLLRRIISLGARIAKPGEFTERAFLNGKIDLAQAEAVADLIESTTEKSVRSAQKSMQGIFSEKINQLVDELTELRIYVEAAIDFVDEEIDFLTDGVVQKRIIKLLEKIQDIQKTAQQGRLLRDGMTLVLVGKPNAGKSSLLNALSGHDVAIVSDIPGTTRDILRERIQLDGMPLHIIDTAGLRDSENSIEKEGIRRAHLEISKADVIILLIDVREPDSIDIVDKLPSDIPMIKVYNTIDLVDLDPDIKNDQNGCSCYVSIKKGLGLELLKKHLKDTVGYDSSADDVFLARRRHIEAIRIGHDFVKSALNQLNINNAGELVAEDLRQAQKSLGEITGTVSSDDLLGKIFSSFCIGK